VRCRRQALRFPVSSLILTVQIIFLIDLVLQIFKLHAPLLSLILRLLYVANHSIRLEHNAAGGHVPLSCISPSDLMYASCPYTTAHFSNTYQEDNQVISWPEFVRWVGTICNSNPLTGLSSSSPHPHANEGAKWDAHDIANRILQ